MSGILRTAWLMYAALPLQRWLITAGVLMLIAGTALRGMSLVSPILLMLGIVLPLLPSLLAGGFLFRMLSAPRAILLIPAARAQLLLGLLLALVIGATLFTVVFKSIAFTRPLTIPADLLLARALLTGTIAVYGMFLTNSAGTTILWILALGTLPGTFPVLMRVDLLARVLSDTLWLLFVIGGLWLAFAVQYLRARLLMPLGGPEAISPRQGSPGKLRASRRTATTLFLSAPTPPMWNYLSGPLMVAVMIFIPYCMAWLQSGGKPQVGLVDMIPISWILCLFAGFSAFTLTPRSRFLWLRGGYSRAELFSLCERRAWQLFILTAAWAVPLYAVYTWLRPDSAGVVGALLLVASGAGACLLYFALTRTRRWHVSDILLAIALGTGMLVEMGFLNGNLGGAFRSPPLLIGWAGVHVLIAILLRLVAVRRWRSIDWLICKPTQIPAAFRPAS